LDRVHDGEFVGIYHADGIALLVRDVGGEGARLAPDEDEDAHAEQAIACAGEAATPLPQRTSDAGLLRHGYLRQHWLSGRSIPSVSSSETWCRNPSCGETETIILPSLRRMG